MKKIRVLLSCIPTYGGTYQYNLNILDALQALQGERFEVTVHYWNPYWKHNLKQYPFRAHHTPHLNRLVEKSPADLWIMPSQESLDYQGPVPVLSTIHDLMHRYESRFPEVYADGQFETREKTYSNMCSYSRGVLVDSETGKKHVQESYGMPEDRIFVLPFIPPKYIAEGEKVSDFDDRYKLPSKFIFYPAHFWAHKNHIRLISAVAMLKKELPDLQLVLVGSTKNAYDVVRWEIEDEGLDDSVHIMGHVPNRDIPEFYRRARALVMPTFFGPTNIPPLEAFQLGCPVAISKIYGIPEQVGDAALLFNPESTSEIADCIRRLWTDDTLCQRLAAKGTVRSTLWGQKQFNQRLLEIVQQLTDS